MKILLLILLSLHITKILAQELENKDLQNQEQIDLEHQKQKELEIQKRSEAENAREESNAQKKIDEARQNELEILQKNAMKDGLQEKEKEEETAQPILKHDDDSPIDPVDPIGLCDYVDPIFCDRDRNCKWDNTLKCTNKFNCPQISLEQCEVTKACYSTPSTVGYCSGPPQHCKPYNFKNCNKDPLCYWLTTQKCLPKDPQPPIPYCGGMNVIQCLQNSQFCNLYGQCFDNKNYCSSLNYFLCINDPACNYTFTQKEQCLDKPKFCSTLNEQDCLQNSQFCSGVYTIPQCVNQFHCNGLNQQQCKENFKYCQGVSTQFSCQPKNNNCGGFTSMDECSNAGCAGLYVNGQFICLVSTICKIYDEQECQNNSNVCKYTPESFTCKNNFDCGSIDDPNHCKLTKGCHLIPSQFKCLPKKQKCKFLSGVDCKKNPACIHVPAKGYCSQDMDFGCANLSLLQCQKNKHCSSKYSCTPKPISNCNQLNQLECKKSPFCQLVEKGSCYDKKYDCNLPYDKCILTKPCQWHPGVQGKCMNNFECNNLIDEECKKSFDSCSFNSTGSCRPI